MSKLKIAVSDSCPDCFTTQRECIYINESRNIDVAAIVLSLNDVTCGKLDEIDATGYGIPVFIATENQERVPAEYLPRISGVFENCESRREFYGRQLVPMYLISEYYELGRFSQGPFFLFTHGDMSVPRKLAAPEEHDALHLPHRIMTPE